jgi:hypothetical protein
MASPSAKFVQPDADGDEQRQLAARGPADQTAGRCGQLGGVRRSGTEVCRPWGGDPAGHPLFVAHQAEQADREAAAEQGAIAECGTQVAVPVVHRAQRGVDRRPGGAEHVPDEEEQDADGDRVQ